jgi:NAD(P)-dependent dehydrogenase (short-subunit alcohol dehydrogenase family)
MKRLEGKIIAVAGGAGGIGEGLVRRYAAEGASVYVGDLNADGARKIADSIRSEGGAAAGAAVDLAHEDSIREFVKGCETTFGGLDGFHANAADFSRSREDIDVVDIDWEVFDSVMNVNARGHALCARHAIPAMLRRGGGVILFTSSGSAFVPDRVRVAYSMSKSAIHALMRHIAVRWGHENVRANVIAPGVVIHAKHFQNKELQDWAIKRVAVNYLGAPEDIAAMGALLMSEEGRYITGQVISVDGGSSMRQ